MAVEIKEVTSRKELRTFVNFPEKIYKDNPYYVPPLVFDQMDTLDQVKGAAQEFCESKLYLAYKDGELVGRVAAIVNHRANEQWNHKEVRFGWIDFIDDREVSKALIEKVEAFGREKGMESIVGPLGFTDFDPEGMLVSGYDCLSTMALIYNHPYYNDHLQEMGFEKDADWIEYKIYLADELPDRLNRLSRIVAQRNTDVHLRPLTRKIVKKEDYGHKVFNLINECYKDLYNFTVLPDHMSEKYLGFYLSILDLNNLSMVENEKGELVAFGISMPSLAKALQKSRGKLFPFGWWHILKGMYGKNEGIELLLIGVRPDYRNAGLPLMVFRDLFDKFHKNGIRWMESNAMLESNTKILALWEDFEHECKKRRRSYIKKLA